MGSFDHLSPRERQCLTLIATPMRPKEIAAELTLSVKTVEAYLASAKGKIGANSSLHAARLYDEYCRSLPENLPEDIPRVEPAANPNSTEFGSVETAVLRGREITLDWQWRTAIIAGMSFVLVLSVLVLVAGADSITRLAHAYKTTQPINH
ncbi:helix-turn-helix transcriptional regulator [Sphingomonas sp.]|uniref:response regulator transcription factor n=1 Tax=Sphingomonas sp. TaxID=28214 RepID=UPI0033422EE7